MSAGLFSCTTPDRLSSPRGRPCRAVQEGLDATGAGATVALGTPSPPQFLVLNACKGLASTKPHAGYRWHDDSTDTRVDRLSALHWWSRVTPPPFISKYACVSGCGLQRVSIRAGIARRCLVLHHVSCRPVPQLHHDRLYRVHGRHILERGSSILPVSDVVTQSYKAPKPSIKVYRARDASVVGLELSANGLKMVCFPGHVRSIPTLPPTRACACKDLLTCYHCFASVYREIIQFNHAGKRECAAG